MKKIKYAMVLAEFVVAIFICGVLLTLSIHMFRANDMTKVPYIYSFLNQIPEANTYVIRECNFSGECLDKGALPDDRETYCNLLTEALGTSGDVNCKDGVKESHKDLDDTGIELYKNFTLINGVTVYNLSYEGNKAWFGVPIKEGSTKLKDEYADIFIGIKVRKSKDPLSEGAARQGRGKIGENIFPVRIMKNGEIIPGYHQDLEMFDDDEFFAYKIVLNKQKTDGETLRENVTVSFEPSGETGSTSDERVTKTTFKDAICRISGTNEIKHYFPEITDISCGTTAVLSECSLHSDKTAYCSAEYIKPQATGIFKFFGI